MSEFDLKAQDWDKNNTHLERSREIARQMNELIPFRQGMKAMEFGAGTALLSFLLADKFSSLTLIDNSKEMIRICNEKIEASRSKHINAVCIDLEKESFTGNFDIIYSQMAFHHVNDVPGMIRTLSHLLNEDGILVIADLYTEDGSFHDTGFTGHKGFDPEWLKGIILKSDFKNCSHRACYVQKKIQPDDTSREYQVFLLIAIK